MTVSCRGTATIRAKLFTESYYQYNIILLRRFYEKIEIRSSNKPLLNITDIVKLTHQIWFSIPYLVYNTSHKTSFHPALKHCFIIVYQYLTQGKHSLSQNGLILVLKIEYKHILTFLTFFYDSIFLTFISCNKPGYDFYITAYYSRYNPLISTHILLY
jgi:hypothetical protein